MNWAELSDLEKNAYAEIFVLRKEPCGGEFGHLVDDTNLAKVCQDCQTYIHKSGDCWPEPEVHMGHHTPDYVNSLHDALKLGKKAGPGWVEEFRKLAPTPKVGSKTPTFNSLAKWFAMEDNEHVAETIVKAAVRAKGGDI